MPSALSQGFQPTDALDFSRIKRVLVVKLRFHGDVLLTTPVLGALKRHYPHLQVDALVYAESQGGRMGGNSEQQGGGGPLDQFAQLRHLALAAHEQRAADPGHGEPVSQAPERPHLRARVRPPCHRACIAGAGV